MKLNQVIHLSVMEFLFFFVFSKTFWGFIGSQQTEACDSEAGIELLEIILSKVISVLNFWC